MPFGSRMSQDIFQFKIDETFRDCQGAIGIADADTIYGKNDKEHDIYLHDTMECTRKAGMQLNEKKCVIKTKECNFFGTPYTLDGVKPSQVQTVKKTILKCRETKEDTDLALLALRTTHLSSNMPSPAESLNGRMFKFTLTGKIQPSKNQEEFRNWLKARQDNQCYYYNRHTKELPELHGNQAIYTQDPVKKTWNPARVIDQGDTPRSYIIETETGAQLRRNGIHLRPNNASNNLANNLSSCIPQGSIASQSSSANPQCSTLTETEKDPRKSRSGREIRAPERLNL